MFLRVVFAGAAAFSVPCLRELLAADGMEVVGLLTGPDRPAGRGRQLGMNAVKEFARGDASARNIALHQPESLRDEAALNALRSLRADLMVVVAFGALLPSAALAIARLGCVNLHASLLPRWRGAAPIARAIEAGDAATGVSLMRMDAGLDTGPVLASAAAAIDARDTAGVLHDRLARMAARLLADNLRPLAAGALTAMPQDESQACYAAKLTKAEARLDWRLDAAALARKVRAFNPWPAAHTEIGEAGDGVRIRVLQAEVGAAPAGARPGAIIAADAAGITVAAGRGALALTVVQKPGGRAMTAGEFINGARIAPGMRCAGAGAEAGTVTENRPAAGAPA